MWKCPIGGEICNEKYCDYYINDIRFGNCALRVNREMKPDEIAAATGMNIKDIERIIAIALKKIALDLTFDKKIDKLRKQVSDV